MMQEPTPALELSGVCRSFGDFSLQDVSFTLPTGCILGMIGENGAGKSTTIRLILGALHRDAGTLRVLGEDPAAPAFAARKEDLGVVLDEPCFPEPLTARQIGRILSAAYTHWDPEVFENYLRRFDVPEGKPFKDLSRGMTRKLSIAAALSHQPRLLVLDEPTAGLDPLVRDEILSVFEEFTRDPDHSILISSHITSDLEKLCDYVVFLHKGQLRFFAEKDRLLEEYGIVSCTQDQRADLPEDAVMGMEQGKYGVQVLVRRDAVSPVFAPERPSLEDIILLLSKGEKSL